MKQFNAPENTVTDAEKKRTGESSLDRSGIFMNIKVVVEQSEDGKYFIYVPALPGVLADGSTHDEAMSSLKEALKTYMEPSEEDLPSDRDSLTEIEI